MDNLCHISDRLSLTLSAKFDGNLFAYSTVIAKKPLTFCGHDVLDNKVCGVSVF